MDLSEIFNTAVPYIGASLAVLGACMTGKAATFNNNQQEETLVTRFGQHIKTVKEPGLNFRVPFVDKIAARVSTARNQISDKLEVKTKDNLFCVQPFTIQYEIINSARAYFGNRAPVDGMQKVVNNAISTMTPAHEFQELFTSRDALSLEIIQRVGKEVEKDFGISIKKLVLEEPRNSKLEEAYNEVRASERAKEAAKNRAEAHKIETIAQAEAAKQSDILRGEGKAGSRKAIFDNYSGLIDALAQSGTPRPEAVAFMKDTMWMDTLRDVGDKGNLVIVTDGNNSKKIGSQQAALLAGRKGQSGGPAAPPAAANAR